MEQHNSLGSKGTLQLHLLKEATTAAVDTIAAFIHSIIVCIVDNRAS